MRPPTRSRWTAGSTSWLTTSDHRTATTPVVLANGRAALARTLSISPLCISPWPAWRPSALATSPPRPTGRRSSPWPWWWWDVSSCFLCLLRCGDSLQGGTWYQLWFWSFLKSEMAQYSVWMRLKRLSILRLHPFPFLVMFWVLATDRSGITMKFWFYWGSMRSWFVLNTQLSAQLHIF